MNEVTPKVFFVGETRVREEGMKAYFDTIGLPGQWDVYRNGAPSDGEALVEVAGRMCYRAFVPHGKTESRYTNPNVTKVREGNDVYLGNILNQKHGSILEHINLTFIFLHVSRVFTHELVRHRAGKAYSQESLRYVRLTDLDFWIPNSIMPTEGDTLDVMHKKEETRGLFKEVIGYLEEVQKQLADIWDIAKMPEFGLKKKLTSMFRRLAPIGTATAIMATGNIRALRHEISMRTAVSAEEEIRLVFQEVARTCAKYYPNFFQDMRVNINGEYEFDNVKV